MGFLPTYGMLTMGFTMGSYQLLSFQLGNPGPAATSTSSTMWPRAFPMWPSLVRSGLLEVKCLRESENGVSDSIFLMDQWSFIRFPMILAIFGGVVGVVPYFWSQPFVVNWLGVVQTGEAQAWILRLGDVCSHFCLPFKYLQNICGYGLKVWKFSHVWNHPWTCFFSCQPSLNRRFFFEPCSFWAGLGPRRAGRFDHLEPCPMGGLGLRWPSGEILGHGWILIEFSCFVPNPKISKISKINPRFFLCGSFCWSNATFMVFVSCHFVVVFFVMGPVYSALAGLHPRILGLLSRGCLRHCSISSGVGRACGWLGSAASCQVFVSKWRIYRQFDGQFDGGLRSRKIWVWINTY